MLLFNIGIYRIKNIINGKCIYGSSKNIKKRWIIHKRRLKNNEHENIILQRSWNKHGSDAFVFELVEECSVEELFLIEQKYIDSNIGGYNIAPAGGGDMLTNHPDREDIIKRISETLTEKNKKLSEKTRKERWSRPGSENPNWRNGGISKKPCPICNKNKISLQSNVCGECRDRTGENNPFYGRTHTDETKQILREINIGKTLTQEIKNKVTGENSGRFMGYYHTPWGIFPSSSQAQQSHDYMFSATIHRWCIQCDKKITKQASSKSKYLREHGKYNNIGKTYRDIGFWFEPKLP